MAKFSPARGWGGGGGGFSSAQAEILASAQNMKIAHEKSQEKTQEHLLSVFVFEEAEEVKV